MKEYKSLLDSKHIKHLANSNTLVCVINKKYKVICEEINSSQNKIVVPKDLNSDVKKVVTGVDSTALINSKGELKFWYN